MKRLILMLAAVTAVATTLPAGSVALARDDDRGRRWEGRDDGPGRGRGRGGENRGWRGRGGDDDRGRGRGRGYERRYDGPPPYMVPRAPPIRPGGMLPPGYRGAPIPDYPRYRLRQPPHGYSWQRAGDAFVLVDRYGRIYDVIPY